MSQKPKKALPLLPEEERELFPGGKPEHPEKVISYAGKFSFFNRNYFTKRAFYLIRNYWRLGKKVTAILASLLYILPVVGAILFSALSGYQDNAIFQANSTSFIAISTGLFIFWLFMYFFAPSIMKSHQIPIYKQWQAAYNQVRHDILGTGRKRRKSNRL